MMAALILDEWSAILPLADYGRIARDPGNSRSIRIKSQHRQSLRLPAAKLNLLPALSAERDSRDGPVRNRATETFDTDKLNDSAT